VSRLTLAPDQSLPARRLQVGAAGTSTVQAPVPGPAEGDPRNDHATRLQAELEHRFAEAERAGRAEGLAAAEAAFEAERARREEAIAEREAALARQIEDQRRVASRELQALAMLHEEVREEAEGVALAVAYAALAKVLGQREAEGALAPAIVAQALRESGAMVLRVRVPARSALPRDVDGIELIEDPALQPGQLRLETPAGEIEAGLAVRLEAIAQALLQSLARDHA
jgi:flagellar biosynthesis/type III secretory pathway protein FliH